MQQTVITHLDELEKHPAPVFKLYDVFNQLNHRNTDLLKQVYSDDLTFRDPFHSMESLSEMQNYCSNLYKKVDHCHFQFKHGCITQDTAYTTWVMTLAHPKLNRGKRYEVEGTSYLKYHEKIYFHQDFFDGGSLLYERIPVVSTFIRLIKSKTKASQS